MNRITLIGHTGHSAVSRATENGGMVTFSLAVSERRRNEQGEWENSRTDWFDCVLYTATKEGASTLGASIKSGTRLAVTGKMQSREYEKDGIKRQAWSVRVDELEFLQSKDKDETGTDGQTAAPSAAQAVAEGEGNGKSDMPF